MRKALFNEQSLVLLGPIISRFFACSNEEKSMHALVLRKPEKGFEVSLTHPISEAD
jgi:hypothetical protein